MKFSLGWLKDHLETNASVGEIADALTDLGLEVESISDPSETLKHFKVGEILSAEKHPQADKLKICLVATSEGDRQIICGAPNARPGIKVVVAQPGDYIPGLDTKIKVGKIRGVESFGMMCSEKELQISDEHEGIIEIHGEAKVGQYYTELTDIKDPIIQISITPNRPDALGVRGIARDLQAKGIGSIIHQDIKPVIGTFDSPIKVTLNSNVSKKDCPLFIGRYFRNVHNGSSPKWLQDRLRAIGLRPISTLVDITNYLTYDQNRPLHVFDANKVKGNLEVRKARENEKIVALDEKEYVLDPTMTVISDDEGVESIGGIMGAMNSGCTYETTNVFVEAAYFNTIATAKTGRRLRIESDARYRFERGIDPDFTETGMELATKLILKYCGGEASNLIVSGEPPNRPPAISLDPEKLNSVVGMTVSSREQCRILNDLGFKVSGDSPYEVSIPSWRPDIMGDIDLLEEISRVISLRNLEGKPFEKNDFGVPKPILTKMQRRVSRLRRAFTIEGYDECITYSFLDKASAELFREGKARAFISNPISSEMTDMRPSIIPGLLMAASKNQDRGIFDLRLFEIGSSFNGNSPGDEFLEASGLILGNIFGRNAYEPLRVVDFFDVKGHLLHVLDKLNAPINRLSFKRNAPSYYHPQRSAIIQLGPKIRIGEIGEIHPSILESFGLKGSAHAFTIFPENIPFQGSNSSARQAMKISDLPSSNRDFAFIVDEKIQVDAVIAAIYSVDKKLIEEVSLFDVFEGRKAHEQFGNGKKSIAFSVKLQPTLQTLKDSDIEELSTKIIKTVEEKTGGSLRS